MKNTINIVTHRTLKDSAGVSLNIARFVQYFNDSFGVRDSFEADYAWVYFSLSADSITYGDLYIIGDVCISKFIRVYIY